MDEVLDQYSIFKKLTVLFCLLFQKKFLNSSILLKRTEVVGIVLVRKIMTNIFHVATKTFLMAGQKCISLCKRRKAREMWYRAREKRVTRLATDFTLLLLVQNSTGIFHQAIQFQSSSKIQCGQFQHFLTVMREPPEITLPKHYPKHWLCSFVLLLVRPYVWCRKFTVLKSYTQQMSNCCFKVCAKLILIQGH